MLLFGVFFVCNCTIKPSIETVLNGVVWISVKILKIYGLFLKYRISLRYGTRVAREAYICPGFEGVRVSENILGLILGQMHNSGDSENKQKIYY